MTALEERIKLSQLVFGENLVDYFHNNSNFMYERYSKTDEFCRAISISDIQIGGFHHFHYDDKSNWMKYSPVFFCDFKQYQNYNNAYESFYNKIIKSQYISEHHPSVIEFESHYKVKPCSGYFKRYSDRDYDALDCNKAYPNCLSKIKNVPVFSFWDVYKNYDSHPIEDLTLYKIQVLSKGEHIAIMFSDKHTIVYGYVLKELTENI